LKSNRIIERTVKEYLKAIDMEEKILERIMKIDSRI